MMFGGGGVLGHGFPHVNVSHNEHPHEHFNVQPLPFSRPIAGFHAPMHVRVVGVPQYPPKGGRPQFEFKVDFETDEGEKFLHFNPRFHEGRVVRNSTKSGKVWQLEEHDGDFPFENQQVFTVDFIAENEFVKISVNGEHFADFYHRSDPSTVGFLTISGDVKIHSVSVSHHSHHK